MKASRILPRRPTAVVIALLMMALVLGLVVYAYQQKPLLDLGVGYGARVACGCRYSGNRSLADCRKDFEPGMELIQLSEDTAAKTIKASVPLVASRTVRYDPLLGCQPEPFAR